MHISDVFLDDFYETLVDPQWNQEVQVHPMQQPFRSKHEFEVPLPNSL